MSYCHVCGGYPKVEYTFGGNYDGTGSKSQIANWKRSNKLNTDASVNPQRVPHKMHQHIASRGSCVDVDPKPVGSTTKPTPAPTSSTSSKPSTYRAADGCLKHDRGEVQTDICLASEHSSDISVNCCSGSMEKNNLKCSRKNCVKRKTFAAAKNYCENLGMRLCSVAELESGACCSKGCGYDWHITWTSDTCEAELNDGGTEDGDGNTEGNKKRDGKKLKMKKRKGKNLDD